jgi:diguanylate cyclase (GGDEF)-like protein
MQGTQPGFRIARRFAYERFVESEHPVPERAVSAQTLAKCAAAGRAPSIMLANAGNRDTTPPMAFSIFPADDRILALRLKRQLMGLVSYLMFLVPLLYSVHFGWMRFGYPGLALVAATAVAINLVFFLVIRSGLSLRMKDPSLLLPQILAAMLLALVVIHNAEQARSLMLMLFYTGLFFGIFGLDTRQFLWLVTVTSIGYAAMVALEFHGQPLDSDRFHLEVLRFVTLVMVLLWLSFLGGYVAHLRLSLEHKKNALAVALTKLERLASRDDLTGVFNRRHLLEIMEHEKERADRYDNTFSVCILDIDHFKTINDTYGHQIGDEVLHDFADRMLTQARGIDWLGRQEADTSFGRYGGEEFLLVLPHTPIQGALLCVERIRRAVNAVPFATSAGPLQIQFSAGITQFRREESIADTLHRADAALYKAKHDGRNRSQTAP